MFYFSYLLDIYSCYGVSLFLYNFFFQRIIKKSIFISGINKFARKILRPHTIPNNEVLDLLSRVPDDEELVNYNFFDTLIKN